MWKLTIEDDQANRTVVPLARDEYSIGRGEDNTVRLTERNISRRHARLVREAERWVVFDAGSYNGCYVNGARVSQRQELAHGDLVQLGDYRLELVDEALEQAAPSFDSKNTVPAAPRSQALLGQPDRLVMLVGPTPGAEFALSLDQRQVIGRGEECDISINHPSVSRVHAEVHALGDGRYELVDSGSANGIRVNGVELPRGLLDGRDVVELGDVVFKFIRAGDVYVPGADESQQISSLGGFEASAERRGMGSGAKVLIALGTAALLGTLLVVAISGGEEPADVSLSAPKNERTDASAKLLAEAKALLDQGDATGARRRADQIPTESNLRDTPEFRSIQSTWADQQLNQARQAEDPAERRKLLEEVARATAVDSMRRKRAANDLAALGGETVDVSDLPSAPRIVSNSSSTGGGPGAAKPGETNKTADEAAATTPKMASAPATLVRKNPFDDPGAAEIPAPPPDSGGQDRTKLAQAKNRLLAKARNGSATESDIKQLRALCRALGDASCSN
jgi:pSer/pThr/pTyr-binding forkhead associated (FHA) protein